MNCALKALIRTMLNQRIIGGVHTPEKPLLNSKTKWLTNSERKQFKKEYKTILNEKRIIRMKKKTKRGQYWHISLNPKKLDELNDIID